MKSYWGSFENMSSLITSSISDKRERRQEKKITWKCQKSQQNTGLAFHITSLPCLLLFNDSQSFPLQMQNIKSWLKECDLSQRCVQLTFRLVTTCDDLRWLCPAQIRTQVDASFSTFGHPTKSTQVDHKSSVNTLNLWLLAICVKLRADLRIRLATHLSHLINKLCEALSSL